MLKMTKIILGVCVLHMNQVAHFDLKLGNILVDKNDNLRISFLILLLFLFCFVVADYGEARQLFRTTSGIDIQAGTTMYMAPEMIDEDVKCA
jgi:serine/threonine protein kinase